MNVSRPPWQHLVTSKERWVCSACGSRQRINAPSIGNFDHTRRYHVSAVRHVDTAAVSSVEERNGTQASSNLTGVNSRAPLSFKQSVHANRPKPFPAFLAEQYSKPPPSPRPSPHDPYKFLWSLRYGKPSEVSAAVERVVQDQDFLQSLPQTTWSEAIRRLDPRRWIDVHSPQPVYLNNSGFRKARTGAVLSRKNLINVLSEIVSLRRQAGLDLTLTDYRMLLQYGAYMKDFDLVQATWADLKSENLHPDVTCFNALMEATLVGSESGLKHFVDKRLLKTQLGKEEPHQPTNHAGEIRRIHSEMIHEYGLSPSTTSYCHLMTAFCRDGDFKQATDVFANVWGFDADVIRSGDVISHVSNLEPGDPLYPTTEMLYTIAETFGYHGRILSALRLVDFISQHYNVPVRSRVSDSLLYWTSFHSHEEGKAWKKEFIGMPPVYQKPAQVFSMLQSQRMAGLNQRTLPVLIASLRGQRMTGREDVLNLVYAGASILAGQVQASRVHLRALRRAEMHLPGRVPDPGEITRHRRRLEQVLAEKYIMRAYMTTWLSNAIEGGVPASMPLDEERDEHLTDWRIRGIPNIIEKYRDLIPHELRYQVPTGVINIVVVSRGEKEARSRQKRTVGHQGRIEWENKPLSRRTKTMMMNLDRRGQLLPQVQRTLSPNS